MHLTADQWDWLIRAACIAIGLVLKKVPWYPTKFVPIASIVVSVVLRLAAGLGIPVEVIAVDASVATGVHSGVKNMAQGVQALIPGRKGK